MPAVPHPRKLLAGAVAAVALGVGGIAVSAVSPIGTVLAQDDPDGTTTTTVLVDESTTTAPGDEGAEPGDDEGRHGPGRGHGFPDAGPLQDVLDGLVEDGTLSREQADAVTDGLRSRLEEWADRWRGEDGDGDDDRGPGVLRGLWEEAASIIGVAPDALHDGLRDGRSLAEIAAEAGVERQDLVDALVAEGEGALDRAVAEGVLDEERAADLAAELPAQVERLVDLSSPWHR